MTRRLGGPRAVIARRVLRALDPGRLGADQPKIARVGVGAEDRVERAIVDLKRPLGGGLRGRLFLFGGFAAREAVRQPVAGKIEGRFGES